MKFKNSPYIQELLDAILLPAALAIMNISFHSILNLIFWKLREITLFIFLQGILPLKGPIADKPLPWSKEIFPEIITKKLAKEYQQFVSEKEKEDWKFNNCWFDKKRKFWFGPNNNPVLAETLTFPFLTTVHP